MTAPRGTAPRIAPFGERALLVTFAEQVDADANRRARALAEAWEGAVGPAIDAYASTVLHYDPLALSYPRAARLALELVARAQPRERGAARLVEIPVRYDGPDLAEVARLSAATEAEIVALHSGRTYLAYFLGFMPGFAYLGELDPRITAPRLDEPRTRVPAGSVAIAGRQTAVYPLASPGGWRLIGRTELALFDPSREPPALVRAGDRVRFVPSP